jgi:hypothetical protein
MQGVAPARYGLIGFAVDLDEGKYYHHLNGEWVRGKPGSNQGGDLKLGRLYHAGVTSSSSLREVIGKGWIKINLGERPFAVPVPVGYRPFVTEKGASGPEERARAAGVLPAHGPLEGKTQSQWTVAYWQWLLAFPADQGPGTDVTGQRCGLNQSGPIWYLAANFGGGKTTRTCRMPRGKSILVPLLTAQAAPKLLFVSVARIASRKMRLRPLRGALILFGLLPPGVRTGADLPRCDSATELN